MNCVRFESVGEPADVLRCIPADRPEPGPGEVCVRMLASPINPSDTMFIRGIYGTKPTLPQVPGFEGVGVVEQSGGGFRGKLFTGKRVAVLNRAGGNWAQHTVVPASQVIPLSAALSVEQAATFFVNPATAWIMTQEVLKVPRGAWLLQTAANSSLGRMVIRLGQKLGFQTLNVVRSEQYVSELKSAGATEVIVFDAQNDCADNFRESVNAVAGPDGLKYAIDPVGGATAAAIVQSLTQNGRLLLFGTLCGDPVQFSPRTLMTLQSSVEGFWLGNFMQGKNLLFKLKLMKRITKLILDGTLTSRIDRTFSLADIHDAVAAAEERGHSGKVLLKPEA